MRRPLVVSLSLVAALGGCTVDIPDTHPTQDATTPQQVIVVQLPSSITNPTSSNGTPVPTVPPSGGSSPSSPAPSGGGGGCSLGKGTGDGNNCPRTSGVFIDDVGSAIDRVMARHPDWFSGSSLIGDPNRYYDAVVAELNADGFCAIFDGEEVALKNTNAFNEQYHVLTSGGVVRKGDASYRATCRPAWF